MTAVFQTQNQTYFDGGSSSDTNPRFVERIIATTDSGGLFNVYNIWELALDGSQTLISQNVKDGLGGDVGIQPLGLTPLDEYSPNIPQVI